MGSSSIELLNDGGGNTAGQPDELAEAISISPLLTVTPSLASLLKSFNEHLISAYLAEQACHEAEATLHSDIVEVEYEQPALGEVKRPKYQQL